MEAKDIVKGVIEGFGTVDRDGNCRYWVISGAEVGIDYSVTPPLLGGYTPEELRLAEISFKAGIMKVVDWIRENSFEPEANIYALSIWKSEWEAILKEWGI